MADRKSLSAHRDVGPEFEAGSGCFHARMVLDRGLRVKRPLIRGAGRAPDPEKADPADVHGILMRVAALEDTLSGKIKAWSVKEQRPSKRQKDLTDILRLTEAHPHLHEPGQGPLIFTNAGQTPDIFAI